MEKAFPAAFVLLALYCARTDLRSLRIPDRALLAFAVPALAIDLLEGGASYARFAAALASGLALWGAGRLSRAGMGFGDVKLGAAGGYALGFFGAWTMLAVAAAAGLVAFAVRGKRGREGRLPFAPFLALGAVAGALVAMKGGIDPLSIDR